jgi:hypothetical protein
MNRHIKESLEGKINGLLQNAQVQYRFIHLDSIKTHLDKLIAEVMKSKSKWLSVEDINSIIFEHVANRIRSDTSITDSQIRQLKGILTEEEIGELALQISNYFFSIPRSYTAVLPIPNIKLGRSEIEISKDIKIKITQRSDNGSFGGLLSTMPEVKENASFIEISVKGYAGFNFNSSAGKESLSALKLIMQRLIASKKLKKQDGIIYQALKGWGGIESKIRRYKIEFKDEHSAQVSNKFAELEIDICQFISTHELHFSSNNHEQHAQEIIAILAPVAKLLQRTKDSDSLRSACEWRFDSAISVNPAIALVQTSIGLESLLGGDLKGKEAGLTFTLSDRCAYLVGTSIESRKKIRDCFTKFYELRSSVAHGSSSELTKNDLCLLNWGQEILDIAISRELNFVFPEKI